MSADWPLRDGDIELLRALVSDLSDVEVEWLAPSADDEFGVAFNLVLYSQFVDAVTRGVGLYFGEYRALCGYRDDLEDGVALIPDASLRQRVEDAVDLIDQRYLACTVSGPLRWGGEPASDFRWWWFRSPRRMCQTAALEAEAGLRDRIK